MIQTILVPLDGSKLAESVLPCAEQIAGSTGAELVLLAAAHLAGVWGAPPDESILTREAETARAYLESKRDQMIAKGLEVKTVVVCRPAPESILNTAADEDVDLIAMTTHGRSGISRWVFGSVTDKVLHATHRPLLLVPPAEPERRPDQLDIQRILVPLDGSELSLSVLPYVEETARALGASLVLVHAVQPLDVYPGADLTPARVGAVLDDLQAQGQSFVDRTTREINARTDLRVRGLVTIGFPVNEIVRVAEEVDANLIAMATHGRSGIGRWVVGSVADAVIRRTSLPCLVIRPKEVQEEQQQK